MRKKLATDLHRGGGAPNPRSTSSQSQTESSKIFFAKKQELHRQYHRRARIGETFFVCVTSCASLWLKIGGGFRAPSAICRWWKCLPLPSRPPALQKKNWHGCPYSLIHINYSLSPCPPGFRWCRGGVLFSVAMWVVPRGFLSGSCCRNEPM